MKQHIKKIPKREDIQIYRAVAVLAVILYHLFPNIFIYGYLGVDIFFVISGFVISNVVYSELSNNKFKYKIFFYNRFKRIVPSLITFIIFVQVIIYFFSDHQQIYQTSLGNVYSLFFLSNLYFSQIIDYFSNDVSRNFIINLWSLSVEEQFYIVFPFLAFFTKNFKLRNLILIYIFGVAFSIIFYSQTVYSFTPFLNRLFFSYENFIFYSPFTRVWQFFLGVLAMFLNQKYRNQNDKNTATKLFTIVPIFLIFFISINLFNFSKILKLGSTMFIIFFLLVYQFQTNKSKNFIIIFFIFVGNISYSLYLFHQPIFASVRNYQFYNQNSTISLYHPGWLTAVMFFVFSISWFNYYYFENKFRRIENFSINKFSHFFAALLFSLILLSTAVFSNGYSFRDNNIKSFETESNLTFIPGTNFLELDNIQCIDRQSIESSCVFNDSLGQTNLYIIGDSVMSSLTSGVIEEFENTPITIIEYTEGSCPLIYNYCNFTEGSKKYNDILQIKDSYILLGGIYEKFEADNEFRQNLVKTIEILTAENKVYLFTPFPNPGINQRMHALYNSEIPDFDYKRWKERENPIRKVFEDLNYENLELIDSENIFCKNKICNFYSNKSYFYNDHAHFTYFGAKKISKYFLNLFLNP